MNTISARLWAAFEAAADGGGLSTSARDKFASVLADALLQLGQDPFDDCKTALGRAAHRIAIEDLGFPKDPALGQVHNDAFGEPWVFLGARWQLVDEIRGGSVAGDDA